MLYFPLFSSGGNTSANGNQSQDKTVTQQLNDTNDVPSVSCSSNKVRSNVEDIAQQITDENSIENCVSGERKT